MKLPGKILNTPNVVEGGTAMLRRPDTFWRMGMILLLLLCNDIALSQDVYQSYSFNSYQKLDTELHATSINTQTFIRSFFENDLLLKPRYDSIASYNVNGKQHEGRYEKLFNQHLIEINRASSIFYGHFMMNEFKAKNFFSDNGSSYKKNSWQLGLRGVNTFGIKGLYYLLENNNVKPYTYSEHGLIENYIEEGEPLAHHWGANFRKVIGFLDYSYNRFNFPGEGNFGYYGLDEDVLNYGKDPFNDYT